MIFSRLKKIDFNDKKLQKVKIKYDISAKWIVELLWEIIFYNEAIWKYLDVKLRKSTSRKKLYFHFTNIYVIYKDWKRIFKNEASCCIIVLVLGWFILFFKISFCCYNDIYEMLKKCRKQKIKSAIKIANYVEWIKRKINFMLTLKNAMNKLQLTAMYFKV